MLSVALSLTAYKVIPTFRPAVTKANGSKRAVVHTSNSCEVISIKVATGSERGLGLILKFVFAFDFVRVQHYRLLPMVGWHSGWREY